MAPERGEDTAAALNGAVEALGRSRGLWPVTRPPCCTCSRASQSKWPPGSPRPSPRGRLTACPGPRSQICSGSPARALGNATAGARPGGAEAWPNGAGARQQTPPQHHFGRPRRGPRDGAAGRDFPKCGRDLLRRRAGPRRARASRPGLATVAPAIPPLTPAPLRWGRCRQRSGLALYLAAEGNQCSRCLEAVVAHQGEHATPHLNVTGDDRAQRPPRAGLTARA